MPTPAFQLPTPVVVLAGALAALLLGASIAVSPVLAGFVVVAGLLVAGAVLLPLGYYVAGAVAALAVIPSLVTMDVPTPVTGVARGGAVIAVLALLRNSYERAGRRVPGTALAAVALYVTLLLVATPIALLDGTRDTSHTLDDLSREVLYPTFMAIGFVGAASLRSARDRERVYRVLGLIAIAIFSSSVIYWMWLTGKLPASGTLGNVFEATKLASVVGGHRSVFPFTQDSPNLVSLAFVMLAGFIAPPLLATREHRDRVLVTAMLVLLVAAVLSTQSRTGLVAIGAAGAAYVAVMWRVRSQAGLAIVAVAFVGAVFVISPKVLPQNRALRQTATLNARVDIWKQAWHAFGERPVIGHGYAYSAGNVFAEQRSAVGSASSRRSSVHSEFFGELVDGGVLGFGAFLAVCGLIAATARRLLRERELLPYAIGFVTAMAATAAGMIDSAVTKSAVCSSLVWLFLGIAAGYVSLSSSSGRKEA